MPSCWLTEKLTTSLHIPLSTTELVKFTWRCSSGREEKLQLLEAGSGLLLVLGGECSWWWWRCWLGSGLSLALLAVRVCDCECDCECDTDACCISCRTTVSSRRVHVLVLGSILLAGFSFSSSYSLTVQLELKLKCLCAIRTESINGGLRFSRPHS